MNNVYKVIWSRTKNCYVVVNEFAKSYTKSMFHGFASKSLILCVLYSFLGFCSFVSPAYAKVVYSNDMYVSQNVDSNTFASSADFINSYPSYDSYYLKLTDDYNSSFEKFSSGISEIRNLVTEFMNSHAFSSDYLSSCNQILNSDSYSSFCSGLASLYNHLQLFPSSQTQGVYRNAIQEIDYSLVGIRGSLLDVVSKIGGPAISVDDLFFNRVVLDYSTALSTYQSNLSAFNMLPKAFSQNSIAIGKSSIVNESSPNSVAIGVNSSVLGDNALALGSNSLVSGSKSVVLGSNSSVSGNNSIALGNDSVATQNNVVSFGHLKSDSKVGGGSYSSVLNRRLINVAEGIDDTDVVNVKQLNTFLANLPLHYMGVYNDLSSSDNSNYNGSGASANGSIAIGFKANARAKDAIVIGHSAVVFPVSAQRSIAIGYTANASNPSNIAIGENALSSGYHYSSGGSIAIGQNAVASGGGSFATGSNSRAYGHGSIAVGNAFAGGNSLDVPEKSTDNNIAIGSNAVASQDFSIAVGTDAIASQLNSVAIGYKAKASYGYLAMGSNSIASGPGSLAIGRQAVASGDSSLSIGNSSSTASGSRSIVLGGGTASANNSLVLGGGTASGSGSAVLNGGSASGNYSLVLNRGSAFGSNSIAIGGSAVAGGISSSPPELPTDSNVAVGVGSIASNLGSSAFGNSSKSYGTYSTALGAKATSSGGYSVAIGYNSNAYGSNSLAMMGGMAGKYSSDVVDVPTNNNVAVGVDSIASAEDSIAFGRGAVSHAEGAIALGQGSSATEQNTLSVGSSTIQRKIVNVADGIVDSDVATFGQLNSEVSARTDADTELSNRILALETNGSSGSGSGSFPGSVSSDVLTLQGTNGMKLTNLKQGTLSAASKDAVIGSQLYATNQNLSGFANDINKNKTAVRELNSTIASALDSFSSLNNYIDSIATIKADASLSNLSSAGKQVINTAVANAIQQYMNTNSVSPMAPMVSSSNTLNVTDAGNGSLHVGEGSVVNGTSSIAIGVGNQVNANNAGAFGDPSVINADASYVLGNDDTVNTGAEGSFLIGNDSVSDAKGGLSLGSNNYLESTAENSVLLGNNTSASGRNSVALGSGSVANEDNVVSLGNANLKRKITNLMVGSLADGSSDAVTGSQLFATNEKVRSLEDSLDAKANVDASNLDVAAWTDKLATGQVQEGNTGLVKGGDVYAAIMLNRNDTIGYDDSANSLRIGGSQRYDGVDVVDISKSDGSARVMTGVATNPNNPTSAANVGYVNAVNDMVIQSVNGSLEKVNTRLNKVGANAAAMSALTPASFEGDERWSLAASVGNYRSETAGAVGAFYKPAENVMMNLRGSFGSDENMVAAGVAVSLSKGDVPGVTKRQLVNTVNAQSQKLENYEHRISELEALVRTLYDRLPAAKK